MDLSRRRFLAAAAVFAIAAAAGGLPRLPSSSGPARLATRTAGPVRVWLVAGDTLQVTLPDGEIVEMEATHTLHLVVHPDGSIEEGDA